MTVAASAAARKRGVPKSIVLIVLGEALADEARDRIEAQELGGTPRTAGLVLDLAFLEASVADRNTVRDADQFQVCKHYARALAAVIHEHLDAFGLEGVVQAVGGLPHGSAAVIAYG